MIETEIPSNQWWCGCIPEIKFDSEYHFVKHMQNKHDWNKKEFDKLIVF